MESFTVYFWADVLRVASLITAAAFIVPALLVVGQSIYVLTKSSVSPVRRKLHLIFFFGGIFLFTMLTVQFSRTFEFFGRPMTCQIVALIIANIGLTVVAWCFVLMNGEVIDEIERNMFRK